ncbi:MAG: hypothetical protein AB7R40_22380 [Nitrospiraceae bacterium]
MQQLAADKVAMEQKAVAFQEERTRKSQERLQMVCDNWGLDELLGLSRMTISDIVVRYEGNMCIAGVPLNTHAQTQIGDWGNIELMLEDAENDFRQYQEISPTLNAEIFRIEMLKFVVAFMDRRQHVLAERRAAEALIQKRLRVARKLVQLATLYGERQALDREQCRQWAERWTRELWRPWALWRVRYVPVAGMAVADDEGGPETIMALEGPDEIITALQQFPTATVRWVTTDGLIHEMEIPSFLDATRVEMNEFCIGSRMAYHRCYRRADVVVNVPAVEEREPVLPARLADFAAWAAEVDDEIGGIVRRFYEADYGWEEIAERSAEQWVEDWGAVFD